MALVAGVYDGLTVVSPSANSSVTSTLSATPSTGQAVIAINSGQTMPVVGQLIALLGGTAEFATVKSIASLNVTLATNIVNASHTSIQLLATPNLTSTAILQIVPSTAQAVVTPLPGSPTPFIGKSITLLGGTPETLTVLSLTATTITFSANIANANHTSMTWGNPALTTQVIVNSGAALIPGSPGGPRQQLHNTWMSGVLSGNGTFYVDWNGGIPQIITSTGTNLPAPLAGYIRLASFTQTSGVVSAIVDLRGSATYSQKLFNTVSQVAVSNKSYARGVYLLEPPGWDDAWRWAKANSATTPTGIAYMGESIQVGNYTSDMMSATYSTRLRDALIAAGYPMYAETYGTGYVQDAAPGLPWAGGGYSPWARTGSIGSQSSNVVPAPFFSGIAPNGDLTTRWTFTSRPGCIGLDLLYYDGASGTWNYSLDGAANVQITSANHLWITRTALTGLTSGVHTVGINTISSTGAFLYAGTTAYYGTTGIGHSFLGQNGAVLWVSLSQDQHVEQWMGRVSHNGAKSFGYPYGASLYVIEIGTDDFAYYTTVGPWQAGFLLSRLIRALRAAGDCSILFVLPASVDPLYSEVYGMNIAEMSVWWQYQDMLYRVAQQWGCAVLNLQQKWSEATGVITAGYTQAYFNGHVTDLGHLDIANTITSLLV